MSACIHKIALGLRPAFAATAEMAIRTIESDLARRVKLLKWWHRIVTIERNPKPKTDKRFTVTNADGWSNGFRMDEKQTAIIEPMGVSSKKFPRMYTVFYRFFTP